MHVSIHVSGNSDSDRATHIIHLHLPTNVVAEPARCQILSDSGKFG
jgi:hypothetical protein